MKNILKSVNRQNYKQKRYCLVHFLCLLAVCWPGVQSAWDNHALACNFAGLKKISLTLLIGECVLLLCKFSFFPYGLGSLSNGRTINFWYDMMWFMIYQAKRLALENVFKMTCFVSIGTQNHNSISQSIFPVESVPWWMMRPCGLWLLWWMLWAKFPAVSFDYVGRVAQSKSHLGYMCYSWKKKTMSWRLRLTWKTTVKK